MLDNLKLSLNLFAKMLIISIFAFFAIIGVSVICNNFFSKEIGYTAFGTKEENGKSEFLYEYKNSDGEDKLKKEYEDKGYTVTTSSEKELTNAGRAVFVAVSAIINIFAVYSIAYPKMLGLGANDRNAYEFGRRKKDMLKGLKIGLIAEIPNALFLAAVIILKNGAFKNFNMFYYKIASSYLFAFYDMILGKGKVVAGDLGAIKLILLALLLLVIPAVSALGYALGFKNIFLGERLVYGKKGVKK